MVQLVSRASDIRITEINLSQVITSTSITCAAFPIISKQGNTHPLLFTNANDALNEYGNPDPSVSMTIQSMLNYFTEGNQAWGLRVVGSGALYSGVLMYADTDGSTKLQGQSVTDPLTTDLSTLVSPGQKAIAYFYPNHGPGSYGNGLSVSITTAALSAPSNFAGNAQTGSGSMAAATYTYQIATLNSNNTESLVSSPVTLVLSGVSTGIASITLTWTAVAGANGYKIYGRTSGGAFGLITTVGGATTTFVDNGTITPDHSQQPITSSANVVNNGQFIVTVYDNTKPNQGALETWTCSLTPLVDSSGTQIELENRINPFSGYLQVQSNVPALTSIPTVGTVAATAMAGGASGSAPTSSQIANAMQVFANKQLYNCNIFVNGGIADPVYQIAMDTLAQSRGDVVNLIDVPSASQKYQPAIDYRNLTLNLNSSYTSLFGPDLLQADLINGQQLYVPFSGWAAALCARTDRVAGPGYSIAGLNRGQLPVLKQRYTYDDGQATALYNAQVNYARTFVGQGIALWEQRTMASQFSALSWLSVRRITNVIKVALYQFLLYSLQEMNSDAIRRQIINACSAYLDTIVNASELNDYSVVCDNSNNTPATANAGVLVVTVILVPMIPIHEIQLQVVISKQGVTFSEVLSQVNGNTQ